jgi:L-ascorbate 6-phosphate lactonase
MIEEIRNSRVNDRELAIFWLWQNSFILKTPKGTLIAIDPYFSHSVNVFEDPQTEYVHDLPMSPEEVNVDYVFCTHDHLDHTDPLTLPKIAETYPKTKFFGTPESRNHFLKMGIDANHAISLDVEKTILLDDVKVTPFYSIPLSTVKMWEKKTGSTITTHYGYLFDFDFVKLFNMGDSSPDVVEAPMTIFKEILPYSPDIAILPIIGDMPERKPEDAYKFANLLKSKIVIPSHYGCFAMRTIDPAKFTRLFKIDSEIQPMVIDYKGKYIFKAP